MSAFGLFVKSRWSRVLWNMPFTAPRMDSNSEPSRRSRRSPEPAFRGLPEQLPVQVVDISEAQERPYPASPYYGCDNWERSNKNTTDAPFLRHSKCTSVKLKFAECPCLAFCDWFGQNMSTCLRLLVVYWKWETT